MRWIAQTVDGETYTENPTRYADLNRDKIVSFGLLNDKGDLCVNMPVEKGESFFYRARTLKFGTPYAYRIYLLGKRWRTSGGTAQTSFYVISEKGETSKHTKFERDWSEPEWFSFEQV